MSDTTQRYFNLRVRDKLGHAAAMAALAAGK
jgi:predicted HicB family RNase H-like nuclease